jgi:hypothetical protein
MSIDGRPDPTLVSFCFDAQTSGGLLVSLAADRVADFSRYLIEQGEPPPAPVGQVRERLDRALVLQ